MQREQASRSSPAPPCHPFPFPQAPPAGSQEGQGWTWCHLRPAGLSGSLASAPALALQLPLEARAKSLWRHSAVPHSLTRAPTPRLQRQEVEAGRPSRPRSPLNSGGTAFRHHLCGLRLKKTLGLQCWGTPEGCHCGPGPKLMPVYPWPSPFPCTGWVPAPSNAQALLPRGPVPQERSTDSCFQLPPGAPSPMLPALLTSPWWY